MDEYRIDSELRDIRSELSRAISDADYETRRARDELQSEIAALRESIRGLREDFAQMYDELSARPSAP